MVSYYKADLGEALVENVLILIVVDDGLVLSLEEMKSAANGGLNPYCSGRWSRTFKETDWMRHCWVLILIVVDDGLVQSNSNFIETVSLGLNPYCSGRWSRTFHTLTILNGSTCLNPYCSGRWSRTIISGSYIIVDAKSLNPYCSGRWSRTWLQKATNSIQLLVLILIVVDDGLVLDLIRLFWLSIS